MIHFLIHALPPQSDQRGYAFKSANYHHIIRYLGFEIDTSMFADDIKPQLDKRKKYPLLTPQFESVNVPHLFFMGTTMSGRDKKRSAMFAIHGFRYAIRALTHVLREKYSGIPWPTERVENSAAALTSVVLETIQYSSSLYQLYGVMCEVLYRDHGPSSEEVHWTHIREIPCDIVFTSPEFLERSFFVVTLEYDPDFGKTKEKFDVFGEDHVNPRLHPDDVCVCVCVCVCEGVVRDCVRECVCE